ncbi:MAG: choline monooxygenase [Phycisphaerae bacterium]|nr:MAG: choline monooxygenase [Phycisphaerae bacterium]
MPGQVKPFTLLEGCLDEPLLLTRDFDDQIHCMSNVCTHRGTILCEKGRGEGGGHERTLTCRYHGRRFGLDGAFKFMPEFKGVEGFPCEKDNLAKVPWGQWGKWLFASLAPCAPLDDVLAPVRARMSWLPLDRFVYDASRSRDYLVRANWALYCDNYLEGFHIPYVHAGLNEVLDYGAYAAELFPWCNLQLGIAKGGEHCFELPRSSPDFGKNVAAYYWWVFPNLMLNFYPWGLSVNVVKPLGVGSTRVSFISYVMDATKLDAGAGSGLDRVEREDEAVVEAVQKGLRSRLYDRGRYSPTREQGVHHFHRLLAAALAGS